MPHAADYQKILDVAIDTYAKDFSIRWRPAIDTKKDTLEMVLASLFNDPPYYSQFNPNPKAKHQEPHILAIPKPETISCLFIALHEVGHVALWRAGLYPEIQKTYGGSTELCASLWAKGYMEAHKLTVPPGLWHRAIALSKTH